MVEQKYKDFKYLLKRFVEQSHVNLIDVERRKTELGISGFESNSYTKEKNFCYLSIDDISFHIHLFNNGSYGPKSGKGRTTLPYINISVGEGTWANLRVTFENFHIVSFHIVIWEQRTNRDIQEIGSYLVKDLGIDDESDPNEKLQEFYDNYISLNSVQKEIGGLNMMTDDYIQKLQASKNLIFRGAPGTGKTYLARQIAAEMIGCDVEELGDNPQFEFVQFHPSYDYTDFVEGLRPVTQENGQIGFELKNGVFKQFCERAKKNYLDAQKSEQAIASENSARYKISKFFENMEFPSQKFQTKRSKFFITDVDENSIYIKIPDNEVANQLKLSIQEIEQLLASGQQFRQVNELTHFFEKQHATQGYSYYLALFNQINRESSKNIDTIVTNERKNFIFLIDEINRGDMAKIFGELFFPLDPNYRGKAGAISTQYANMHETEDKFYIPENVYIIGTMNDIDRSVDSFDFAMRRRFRFVEVKAEDRLEMLDEQLGNHAEEAKTRLTNLNNVISVTEGLNSHYHIGPSYFLKLKNIVYDYDVLWSDYLEPLLEDYVRGQLNEAELMESFKDAYYLSDKVEETADDTAQG
ncbi:AAA family ATPase [Streptococcus orisratti]|uniref:AAA family ATPase n=1 Tax=Streptococcus orisratti TaxID=114652 RepID=UPI0029421DE1|nr:AAA family ATPase [Streptococcus orisratti]